MCGRRGVRNRARRTQPRRRREAFFRFLRGLTSKAPNSTIATAATHSTHLAHRNTRKYARDPFSQRSYCPLDSKSGVTLVTAVERERHDCNSCNTHTAAGYPPFITESRRFLSLRRISAAKEPHHRLFVPTLSFSKFATNKIPRID